ncbi:MAG: HD domain-containing protein [Candidatus Pacebacteria bacterium]|nr:HD domain-containing protein [Candidatus Paceibacterota bacterium]
MTDTTFRKIVKEVQGRIVDLAKKNGWMWFYNLHQKEVVESANDLLKLYPKAERKIVLISCWLHDIAHYYAKNEKEILVVKKSHHIDGAKIAGEILVKYKLNQEEMEKIKNCVLNHRNHEGYKPKTLEEKVVATADSLSHFKSIFYLTYFKFHPEHSLEVMVEIDLEKIERDWRDLGILPKSRKIAELEYKVLKKMLSGYRG